MDRLGLAALKDVNRRFQCSYFLSQRRRLASASGCLRIGHSLTFRSAPTHIPVTILVRRRFFSTKFVIDPNMYRKEAFEDRTGTSFSPLHVYEDLTASSAVSTSYELSIQRNEQQVDVINRLDVIYRRLFGMPQISTAPGVCSTSLRGMYIYGPAGSGKSMCMDLFFYCCQEVARSMDRKSDPRATRKHFHEFMYQVHRDLHRLQQEAKKTSSSCLVTRRRQSASVRSTFENLKVIAQEIRRGTDILCFDEFAIATIQDCVVLTPLFVNLFAAGVQVVITSNRHPDELYEGGLNREQHLPQLLNTLYENMRVEKLETQDYRVAALDAEHSNLDAPNFVEGANGIADPRGMSSSMAAGHHAHRIFFGRGDTEAEAAKSFVSQLGITFPMMDLTKSYKSDTSPSSSLTEVEIGYGRKLSVEAAVDSADGSACKGAARFDIGSLIKKPLSADDYNALCRKFHTILVDGLWVFQVEDHNEAKRMTNFLDTAYENHVLLVLTGMENTQPEALFAELNMMDRAVHEELILERDEDVSAGGPSVMDPATLSEFRTNITVQRPGAGASRPADGKAPPRGGGLQVRKEEVVRKMEAIQGGVQSCLFYSADHKDWSVESKFVLRADARSRGNPGASVAKAQGSLRSSSSACVIVETASSPVSDQRSSPSFVDIDAAHTHLQQPSAALADDGDPARGVEDPTAEQESVKGVVVAAVASLHETSFAVKRAISRLNEMQTRKYMLAHRQVHGLGMRASL